MNLASLPQQPPTSQPTCCLKTRAHRSCGRPAHFKSIKRALGHFHRWALIALEILHFPTSLPLIKMLFQVGEDHLQAGHDLPSITSKLCSQAVRDQSHRMFQLCQNEHSTRKPQSPGQPLDVCLPLSLLSLLHLVVSYQTPSHQPKPWERVSIRIIIADIP